MLFIYFNASDNFFLSIKPSFFIPKYSVHASFISFFSSVKLNRGSAINTQSIYSANCFNILLSGRFPKDSIVTVIFLLSMITSFLISLKFSKTYSRYLANSSRKIPSFNASKSSSKLLPNNILSVKKSKLICDIFLSPYFLIVKSTRYISIPDASLSTL